MPIKSTYEKSVLDYFAQLVRSRMGVDDSQALALASKIYGDFNKYLYAEFKKRTAISGEQIKEFQQIYKGSPDVESLTFLEHVVRNSNQSSLNGLLVEILQSFSQDLDKYFN